MTSEVFDSIHVKEIRIGGKNGYDALHIKNVEGNTVAKIRINSSSGGGNMQIADSNGTVIGVFSDGTLVLGGSALSTASAIMECISTSKGFIPPKMTTAQRDAISPSTAGLVIYNTTTGKINVRGAAGWEAVTSA